MGSNDHTIEKKWIICSYYLIKQKTTLVKSSTFESENLIKIPPLLKKLYPVYFVFLSPYYN